MIHNARDPLRPLQNLLETMVYVCELLTREPEGGSAMIPLRMFLNLYGYLADLDCSGNVRYYDVEAMLPVAETTVSELSTDTIDLIAKVCEDSCEFTETEKKVSSIARSVSLPVE